MKQIWTFICVILIYTTHTSFAQVSTKELVDSLQVILYKAPNNSSKVNILNELAWVYRNHDYQKAFEYGTQAKNLAIKIKDKKGLATAYNRLGIVYKNKGAYDQALQQYNKALTIEKEINHPYGISRAYNQIGVIFIRNRNYKKAIPYFEKSIRILKSIGQPSKVGNKKMNLAICYKNLGNIKKAIQLYLDAIDIFQKLSPESKERELGRCYLGLSALYMQTYQFSQAREYLDKAIQIFEQKTNQTSLSQAYYSYGSLHFKLQDYNTALTYYQKALGLKKELGSIQDIQIIYNNLGNIYLAKANLEKARSFFLKSLNLAIQRKDNLTLALVYQNLGLWYKAKENYPKAIEYFQKSLDLIQEYSYRYIQMDVLKYLSFSYAQMKKHDQSFTYLTQYNTVRDSLEANFRAVIEYKDTYEQEKKKRELLELENQIQQGQITKQTLINYILGFGLLLLAIITLAIVKGYKDRIKVNRQRRRIDNLLREQEFLALNKMLEGQEQERNRIAQDLHDRLGGMLSVVKLRFEKIEHSTEFLNTRQLKDYQQAMQLLDNACDSIRNVSHNISSKSLQKFGLIAALHNLQVNIEQLGAINIDLIDTGFENTQRLPIKLETQVYRIIQELISNVLKHARASKMEIQLYRRKNELHISVEDNGKGFDVAKAQEKKSLGFAGINARIEALAGTYSIDSQEGQGTSVMIDIPLEEKPFTELPKKPLA